MSGPAETALALAAGGRVALELHRERLNDLNVYPVPDGDTGSNLLDTVVALDRALREAQALLVDRRVVARTATRAALMGARGNSGVILSQIVRGFAEALGAERGELDSHAVARSLRAASDCAYRAVRQPVEGTMLTAIREMAEAAERECGSLEVAPLLDAVLTAGDVSVERTPHLLEVLRQAGVVDAGAAGLVEFARGAVAGLRGQALSRPSLEPVRIADADLFHREASRYRYCTTFVVEGDAVDAAVLERQLDPLGDCLLVVGERPTCKVHVHTDDPGAALSAGIAMGTIDRVEIANMHEQALEREHRLRLVEPAVVAEPATGLVAVVVGEGNERAFHDGGASHLISGGQSMNPSAGEIAQAVAATPGRGVLILPNNTNVILAAEHAATLADRPVQVIASRSIASGRALLEAFDPARTLDENAARLGTRNAGSRHGELTVAVRDARVDGIAVSAGDHIAVLDGLLISSSPDPETVASALIGELAKGGAGRILLVRGSDAPFDLSPWLERQRAAHAAVTFELCDGGQPLHPLLVWAEGAPLLTAENTALVLDSTADLAEPQRLHRNWRMVPLSVRVGDRNYLDFIEMTPEEFYRRLPLEAELPRTAAPSPGAYQAAFEELAGYDRILVLPVSSRVSASAQSAELGARAVDPAGARITVLDGRSVSAATLLLADGLQRLLVRGVAENELVEWFEQARHRLALLFSVETLEFLQRGGRIGRTRATIGGLLRVRPLLTLHSGEVGWHGRVIGGRRVVGAFERFLCDRVAVGEVAHVALCHAGCPQAAEELGRAVSRSRPSASIDHVTELGAVVGAHGGPGTVGMAVLPGE